MPLATATRIEPEPEPESQAIVPRDPMALLAMAVQQGNLPIETLERLMALQERWQKQQAEQAFFLALAKFQAVVPRLTKTKLVRFQTDKGVVEYHYCPLSDIDEQIKPAMLECQLTKRWEIKDEGESITVTCIITHALGHSEATMMTGAPDASGRKNPIQQRASTVSFLQRYTIIGALGLATADEDIDARLAGGNGSEKITHEQALYLEQEVKSVNGNMEVFKKTLGVTTLEDLPLLKYGKAVKLIADKRKEKEKAKK